MDFDINFCDIELIMCRDYPEAVSENYRPDWWIEAQDFEVEESSRVGACSESSLEEKLPKFDPRPEHPKYNRSVNGILQDRITECGLWKKKKK
ncbi:hypothetical protein CEXT_443071 [Caerostris extrusa]|uniref:Uncharacterized protein n=1 Tax=Caerostris extrusa TaxID=172846 RepID=A0AAV4NNL0_CAEEX|nr:hypothetical protein CEXT_443071 [Caerostris extrusa]